MTRGQHRVQQCGRAVAWPTRGLRVADPAAISVDPLNPPGMKIGCLKKSRCGWEGGGIITAEQLLASPPDDERTEVIAVGGRIAPTPVGAFRMHARIS